MVDGEAKDCDVLRSVVGDAMSRCRMSLIVRFGNPAPRTMLASN